MQMKKSCSQNQKQNFCAFFNELKYYGFSAHDTTLSALSSALRFNRTNFDEDGNPEFSSALTIELWQDEDGADYLKFLHFKLDPENFTNHIIKNLSLPFCSKLYCTTDELATRLKSFKPIPNQAILCDTKLGDNPAISTTTKKPDENSGAQILILSFIPLIFAFLLNN
uniref:Uncharacterized protein n=1 Tax=Panagrolaimus sp. PS1159 TaxID=55785 RepID=A0AC35G1N9_9BILA